MTDSCLINYVTAGSYLAASNNTITISGYIPSSRVRFSKITSNKYKVLLSHNSSKPRLRICGYLDKAVMVLSANLRIRISRLQGNFATNERSKVSDGELKTVRAIGYGYC